LMLITPLLTVLRLASIKCDWPRPFKVLR
jgi:hypothetical protein